MAGDPEPDPADLRSAFEAAHEERYGYADPEAELELVTVRVAVALPPTEIPAAERLDAEERGAREALFDGERTEATVVRGVPQDLSGPAIVELEESTVVVPPGWRCAAVPGGLSMERERSTR